MEQQREQLRADRRRKQGIALVCGDRLKARIDCVKDELRRRGHDVQLVTGPQGRKALSAASPDIGLRVLCVSDQLDADMIAKLERELAPKGEGDLLVVALDRSASAMADRIAEFRRQALQRRRSARATRVRKSLALPTARRSQRWLWPAAAAATAGLALLIGLQLGMRSADEAPPPAARPSVSNAEVTPQAPVAATPADDTSRRKVQVVTDEPADTEILIFDDARATPRRRPARGRPRPRATAANGEPAATHPFGVATPGGQPSGEPAPGVTRVHLGTIGVSLPTAAATTPPEEEPSRVADSSPAGPPSRPR